MSNQPTQSDSLEPTTRLRMAKILKDYKDETVDYIRTAEALEALYAPKPDDISELNKMVHPELNGACVVCGLNPVTIDAHYAAKEQGAVLRATANSKKLITELISLYGIPICDNLHHPKKYQHSLSQKCPVEVRLSIITNQLNQMKGEK